MEDSEKGWESVQKLRKCEKVWENLRMYAKSWESVPKIERVWESVTKTGGVQPVTVKNKYYQIIFDNICRYLTKYLKIEQFQIVFSKFSIWK